MAKKNLLLITPVMPSTIGRGRNHRAFQWVNFLSREYDVSVLCTSVYGDYPFRDNKNLNKLKCKIFEFRHEHSFLQRIRNLFLLRPSTWNKKGVDCKKELKRMEIPRPDTILCFRIQNAPVALQAGDFWNVNEIWLDLDELDSRTKADVAGLMYSRRYFTEAAKLWINSWFYSHQERRVLHLFDRIFTSTKTEREHVEAKFNLGNIEIFENKLPDISFRFSAPLEKEPFNILFVGDSLYFPNRDAIDLILFEIVPELKRISKKPFRFMIVGGNIEKRQLHQVEKSQCVDFYNDVDDLKKIYQQANAVIVPLRTGGGSSLKFLEALRYQKPVISTPTGIRGFDITAGEQALIGQDAKELASLCKNLIEDSELANKLSKNGYQWFIENNSYKIAGKKRELLTPEI